MEEMKKDIENQVDGWVDEILFYFNEYHDCKQEVGKAFVDAITNLINSILHDNEVEEL